MKPIKFYSYILFKVIFPSCTNCFHRHQYQIVFPQDWITHTQAQWPPSAPIVFDLKVQHVVQAPETQPPSNSINSQFGELRPLSRCVSAWPHGLMWNRTDLVQHTQTAGLPEPNRRTLPVCKSWMRRGWAVFLKLILVCWVMLAKSGWLHLCYIMYISKLFPSDTTCSIATIKTFIAYFIIFQCVAGANAAIFSLQKTRNKFLWPGFGLCLGYTNEG